MSAPDEKAIDEPGPTDKLSGLSSEKLVELLRKQLVLQKRLKSRIETLEAQTSDSTLSPLKLELADYKESVSRLNDELTETKGALILKSEELARVQKELMSVDSDAEKIREENERLTNKVERLTESQNLSKDQIASLLVENERIAGHLDREREVRHDLEDKIKDCQKEEVSKRLVQETELLRLQDEARYLLKQIAELTKSQTKSNAELNSVVDEYERYRQWVTEHLENSSNVETDKQKVSLNEIATQTDSQNAIVPVDTCDDINNLLNELYILIVQTFSFILSLFESFLGKLLQMDERMDNITKTIYPKLNKSVTCMTHDTFDKINSLRAELEVINDDCKHFKEKWEESQNEVQALRDQIVTLERHKKFSEMVRERKMSAARCESSSEFVESLLSNNLPPRQPGRILFVDDLFDTTTNQHTDFIAYVIREREDLRRKVNELEGRIDTFERNEQRLANLHNVEYIKNVLLKFITLGTIAVLRKRGYYRLI